MDCAGCNKPITDNRYAWRFSWAMPNRDAPKSFDVWAHKLCADIVCERIKDYLWEQRMSAAWRSHFGDDTEYVELKETP